MKPPLSNKSLSLISPPFSGIKGHKLPLPSPLLLFTNKDRLHQSIRIVKFSVD